MDSKGKIYMYAQHVGDGYYQVFIKNISHEADFLNIAMGQFLVQNGKKQFSTTSQSIISPFEKGLKLWLDDFNTNSPDYRKTYFIDTKLRKPTRITEMLEVKLPAKGKLLKTIGSETELVLMPRKSQLDIDAHLDTIRINMKDRYEYLLKTLGILNDSNHPSKGALTKLVMNELLQINELVALYNQGVPVNSVGGTEYGFIYGWLIKDFGLPEPNGKPPKVKLKIDLGLPEEE